MYLLMYLYVFRYVMYLTYLPMCVRVGVCGILATYCSYTVIQRVGN